MCHLAQLHQDRELGRAARDNVPQCNKEKILDKQIRLP